MIDWRFMNRHNVAFPSARQCAVSPVLASTTFTKKDIYSPLQHSIAIDFLALRGGGNILLCRCRALPTGFRNEIFTSGTHKAINSISNIIPISITWKSFDVHRVGKQTIFSGAVLAYYRIPLNKLFYPSEKGLSVRNSYTVGF